MAVSSLGTNSKPSDKPLVPTQWLVLFALVSVLFFLWGVANNLNDILIQQFKKSFELSRLEAGLVQSAFYIGYFTLAIPAALMMRRFGYKAGMITGLLLFGVGTLLFWPAAVIGKYGFFLFALFVIGSGLSCLETASNPFVAELGDPETSEQRLNLAQSFNPVGNISGVLMGTLFIFSGVEKSPEQVASMKAAGTYLAYTHGETLRVVPVYIVVSVVVFLWALLLATRKFPVIAGEDELLVSSTPVKVGPIASAIASVLWVFSFTIFSKQYLEKILYSFGKLLGIRHFRLAVFAQFLYVGAQVCIWSYFIQYVMDYTHQPEKIAGYMLTASLVMFLIGRFFATWLMKFFRPNKLMAVYAVINVALCALGILLPGWVGMGAMLSTSFFMSLMFPTIFALGIKDLGSNTKLGGAMIVMGIVGGAVLTPLMGKLSQVLTLSTSLVVPLCSFVFIAFYSLYGYKINSAE
jgi:FHS family L-fucose permease-like MFS transporter